MEDHLSEGWTSEPIDFDANNNTSCRIQLWGFRSVCAHIDVVINLSYNYNNNC